MRKKLKTCRGATIAEMLIAIVLLALLTAGGITATSAVMAGYHRMMEAAHADILASTVIETFSNEVRLGRDFLPDPDGKSFQLDSAFFGEDTTLTLAGGRLVAQKSGATDKPLLSDDTYDGLHLAKLTFEKVEPTGAGGRTVYAIRFDVCNASGGTLWSGEANAAPMQ